MLPVKIMNYDEFILDNNIDVNDLSRMQTSLTMNKNRLNYLKYVSYKTGMTLSHVIESMLYADFETVGRVDVTTGNVVNTLATTYNPEDHDC